MSSRRLPGKVLTPVNGQPMIQYTIDRLWQAPEVKDIIVATSMETTDDPIVEFCETAGVKVERGSLNNVTERFAGIVRKYNLETFVRICADSPMIDPRLVNQGIEIYQGGTYDLVTNVMKRSFPKGQSFEVVRSATFLKFVEDDLKAEEMEHVTRRFYNHPDQYQIFNVLSPWPSAEAIQLSVDTAEDFEVFSRMMQVDPGLMERGWRDLIRIQMEMQDHEFAN